MSEKVVLHTFANGSSIFMLPETWTHEKVEQFRDYLGSRRGDVMSMATIYDVDVVEHANPLGAERPVVNNVVAMVPTFDALSHAFGGLGWEVEDEQIEALISGLSVYYSEER